MPRLASGLAASALMRRAQQAGGFAALVRRGDENAGALLVLTLEKGRVSGLFEQVMAGDGRYVWTRVGPQDVEVEGEMDPYIQRRIVRDPDLWVLELDIPDAARFIADSASQA